MDLTTLTIESVRNEIAQRQTTAESLTERFYAAIRERDPEINAYLTLCEERALAKARSMDALADRGDPLPPLAGVPIAVKDVISTLGVRTTCGSKILENYVPQFDATAVQRLEAAGAVILGKVNCDEFAMGSSTENSAYGPVRNPRALDRVPGGSSGGSAAVVANGTAVAALGSDTGGSIRQPASFCGVVGLLPTYGRVSRFGLVAFASSLDHVGPLARTAKDAALILGTIAGRDPLDSTSADIPVPDYVAGLEKPIAGLRLGIPREAFGEGLDREVERAVRAAVEKLARAGCEIVDISLPHSEQAIATYYIICTAEASSNLARYDGVRYGSRDREAKSLADMYRKTRNQGFGREVKRRILLGTYVLSHGYYDAYYRKAQVARSLIARDFHRAFERVDVIVTPTTPTPAFKLGEKTADPLAMYLNDIYTVTGDLAGIPGVSVPCGGAGSNGASAGAGAPEDGLPIGIQFLGRHFEEGTLLRLAHHYERLRAA
jgi:aspartyl-tRNA(Asn)/glutamyl-tRNA(Gln) amidotransferase subunit A